jgi:hypothetical protein
LCARPQPFARPSTAPYWGETLSWEVDAERLRRVSATGTGQLKLTGARARVAGAASRLRCRRTERRAKVTARGA